MNGVEKKNERRIVVGRRLREAREGQGSSLKEAEQAITVHAHHLEALERGDFEALPSPVWARAFPVMYANHLGLEGEELARGLFPSQRQSRPESRPKHRRRWLLAALGAVSAAAMITVAAVLAPYDAPTGPVSGALHRLAPEPSSEANRSASPSSLSPRAAPTAGTKSWWPRSRRTVSACCPSRTTPRRRYRATGKGRSATPSPWGVPT